MLSFGLLAILLGWAGLAASKRDAATLLTLYLGLLLLLPSRYVVGAVSGSFTPALAVSMALFWLYLCFRIVPSLGLATGPQPLRLALLLLLLACGASWAAAYARPLPPAEGLSVVVGLATMAGLAGIALVAADGIATIDRLYSVVRWVVVGVALMAAIAIVQFLFNVDPYRLFQLPGLQAGADAATYIGTRSSFRRVGGTTAHPIELAVALTIALPLALHMARRAGLTQSSRLFWWGCTGLIVAAIPATVSRSGVLGAAIVGLVLLPFWPGRDRVYAIVASVVAAVGLRVAFPGLGGTILSLITQADGDPSIAHRFFDYTYLVPFIQGSPVFGRGIHTFIPNHSYDPLLAGYPYIDNQYLMTLVDTGFVGLCALVGVFAVGLTLAFWSIGRSRNAAERDLAASLAAAITVAALNFATFDALSFPTAAGLTFLMIGCAGALWRLQRRPAEAAEAVGEPVVPVRSLNGGRPAHVVTTLVRD